MTAPAPASLIHVSIAHQDPYVAAGIAALLRSRPDFVVLSADAGAAPAHVVVADYETGIRQATPGIRRKRPMAACLVVTDQNKGWQIRRAIDAGVRGYLLQDCTADELSEAVRSVASGRRSLSPAVAEQLLDSLSYLAPTARQLQVLQLIGHGLSNKDIGRRLGICEGTVKTHVKAILEKLGEPTRTAAMAEAIRRGMLLQESPWRSAGCTAGA